MAWQNIRSYGIPTFGGLGTTAGYGYARRLEEMRRTAPAQRLYQQFGAAEAEAKAANVKREKEIRKIYSDILNSITGSESSLRASGLADIERQTAKLVGGQTQQMISSGLYGTTTAAAVPRQVEAGYAQPARLKLEDLLATRKREAQLGLAGFVERIQTPYPDYNALMQAMIAAQT